MIEDIYLVQYLSFSGKWRNAVDIDGNYALFYDKVTARQFAERIIDTDKRVVRFEGAPC